MGFIKHALIGIAVYEAVKYFTNKDRTRLAYTAGSGGNSFTPTLSDEEIDRRLATGSNPDVPLNGHDFSDTKDPWKDSLADDVLRAPDS